MYAAIVDGDRESHQTFLGRSEVTTIRPAPCANETSKVYLPRGKNMLACPGSKVSVYLNCAAKTNS